MKRREFITLLGGAAACLPLPRERRPREQLAPGILRSLARPSATRTHSGSRLRGSYLSELGCIAG